MKNKAIFISIDGCRADAPEACGNPFVDELKRIGTYTLDGRALMPSVTLPCHVSMFRSVPPERHGTVTNVYMPPVRPVSGLFEQIAKNGKTNMMVWSWEELRDLGEPGTLKAAYFENCHNASPRDVKLTDVMFDMQKEQNCDFIFLYLGDTDNFGHDYGWMSKEYLDCVSTAFDCVRRVYERLGSEYEILVTADHGGHDRRHGSDIPDDINVPMFAVGEHFPAGKVAESWSIMDVAPTIADIIGVPHAPEWEGKSLVEKQ